MKTYFIQAVTGGPIKIGRSVNPQTRLRELQTSHSAKLRILAVIDADCESALHSQFHTLRLQGEWFACQPELVNYLITNTNITAKHKKELLKEIARPLNVEPPAADRLACDRILERDAKNGWSFDVLLFLEETGPSCDCEQPPIDDLYNYDLHDGDCAFALWSESVDLIANQADRIERVGIDSVKQTIWLVMRNLRGGATNDLGRAALNLDDMDDPWNLALLVFEERTGKEGVVDAWFIGFGLQPVFVQT